MSKYGRLGKNILLVFVGNAGAKFIGLLMLPFYTRWLSVEDYGTTDIISIYATLILGIVTACIADAIFIFPKGQSIEKQKSYFSSGLFFSFISLLITAFLFEVINIIFRYNCMSNSFIDNIWLIYGLLVTSFLQQYTQQFVRSIDKMKVYSITGIVSTCCVALFSFFIIPKWGVFGFVLVLIFANLLASVYSFLFSGSFKYLAVTAIEKKTCMEMLKYSIPLIPNSIMWWLVGALNRPVMESYLGMHAIGIFAVANRFPGILSMIFSIFSSSWQISVLEEFGKEGYSNFFNKMFRLLIVGLMFCFFIIAIACKFLVSIFATENFYEAWRYIPILVIGVVFSSVSGFVGSNFSATRESKYYFYSSVWGAISTILFNFIFIPLFGIMGAAISIALSLAIMAIVRIKYGWKYVKIQNIKTYILILATGILTIFVLLYIHEIWIKNLLITILLLSFLGINYEIKGDIFKVYKKIKLQKIKNK
jgi:O-antigen/teichoic acid export membrane protein